MSADDAREVPFPKWRENRERWKRVGGDFPYHYLGSAVWFTRIGRSAGEAVPELHGVRSRP